MMKKVIIMLTALCLTLVFIGVGFSKDKGNSRKGKYLYRQNCRTCHKEDASAPPLSPDSKTMAQWKRIFEPEKYKELACKEEWEKRSADELLDIYTYLYKGAADSPTPAKCK